MNFKIHADLASDAHTSTVLMRKNNKTNRLKAITDNISAVTFLTRRNQKPHRYQSRNIELKTNKNH
ncbi:MAG: hypothetical protein VX481_09720, partial [Cyanobacteriota bacterium]|nr:hypothetical protein [Cyanobacteriota bacterium]